MAFKDQTLCYRTFAGIKWPNLCDVLNERDRKDIELAKAAGVRIKLRKHPEGYHQAFYHPEDDALLTETLQEAA